MKHRTLLLLLLVPALQQAARDAEVVNAGMVLLHFARTVETGARKDLS
jgi:hypothetical protein